MSEEFIVKDSGKRESFNSGAVRDTSEDKPRPDLISPFFLKRLGVHMAKGAKKYSAHNWAKGIPNSRCYESCMRHLMQFAMGDRTEDHLSAAAFNIMAMVHNEEVTARNVNLVLRDGAVGLVDMPVFVKGEEVSHRVPRIFLDRFLIAKKGIEGDVSFTQLCGAPKTLGKMGLSIGDTLTGIPVTSSEDVSSDSLRLYYVGDGRFGHTSVMVGDLI